jgi:hypothetical protein
VQKPPPSREDFSLEEKKAIRGSWVDFDESQDSPLDNGVDQ